jgi:hypothetical protein
VTVEVNVLLFAETPTPVKAGIFPLPEAARPIVEVLLIQVKLVPAEPVKLIGSKLVPIHLVWLVIVFTEGLSPIVKLKEEVLGQEPLVVYVNTYAPGVEVANDINPVEGFSVRPIGEAVNSPPFFPVIFAIGFASKVVQNELLGYVKDALSFAFT